MNTLQLIIKQKHFNDILSGEKTKEFREIRPTTAKKYCEFKTEGEEITLVGPRKYDQIQFFVGYEKNRPSAIVEVKDAEITIFTDETTGEPITYEENGEEYIESEVIYTLGAIVSKTNC